MSAAAALQKAIVAALKADAPLQALIGAPARVYDDVPHAPSFPFVAIGEAQERDQSGDAAPVSEHRFLIACWSRAGGRREVKTMLGLVRACLDDAALALEGHTLIALAFQSAETQRQSDGETYQGIARFRAVTAPAP